MVMVDGFVLGTGPLPSLRCLDEEKLHFSTSISTLQPLSISYMPYALKTETYITACHRRFCKGKLLALVIIVWGKDITREICSGAHIPGGTHITVTLGKVCLQIHFPNDICFPNRYH